MQSLATQLRNAVLNVIVSRNGVTNMTDDDYAFLNFVSTYGQGREAGVPMGVILEKVNHEQWPQPDSDEVTAAALKSAVSKPGAFAPGETGPAITLPAAEAPAAALSNEDQAKLPLGEADRGPEPQSLSTLAETPEPEPAAGETIDTIDPTAGGTVNQEDIPPDYTKLAVTK